MSLSLKNCAESTIEHELNHFSGRFQLDGIDVKVRMDDKVFKIGCFSVNWRTWDKLKDVLEAGR